MSHATSNYRIPALSDLPIDGNEFSGDNNPKNTVHLLSTRGFLNIHGPDAAKFLQGQLTCDINTIDASKASRGAHCTPKGRALATFVVAQQEENNFLFSLPIDNQATLQKSLGKYIVFSKAKIEENTELFCLGLSGPNCIAFLEEHFAIGENNFVKNDNGMALKIDENRVELWLNEAQIVALWPAIQTQFTPQNNQSWINANIEAGLVEIDLNSSDEYVPQMIGLKEDDGISYKKGCYTGQEIVARLHFLGKQKRQLYWFDHQQKDVSVGSKVQNTEGKDIGAIVSLSDNKALAVLSQSDATVDIKLGEEISKSFRIAAETVE